MSGPTHAIVVGGSVAGLCAARVLAERFERVTVLDRDVFPDDAQHRKGVPQSRHPHVLLDGGRQQLEGLFPGFVAKMLAGGAHELDPGLDMAVLRADGWAPRQASTNTLLFSSRVLIESVIRELCLSHENIQVIERSEVTGFVSDVEPLRVRGVRFRESGDAEQELEADLVVDASGRETNAPKWLAELDLPSPEQTIVNANSGYSTRWYQGPPPDIRAAAFWWRCLWLEPVVTPDARPEDQYFGLLFPIEGDRWIITTASWGGRELPRDEESFDRIIAQLRTPALAEALKHAEPISPVYTRRGMQNAWRHYERWSVELPGFISTGDATCGFNPVYGQGMTSAACCARVLERCLAQDDPTSGRFAKKFFKKQAEFLSTPWMMATSRDRLAVEDVDSNEVIQPSRLSDQLRRIATFYLSQIGIASERDDVVRQRLFEIVNLRSHPKDLIADPRILARVIWARFQQRRTSAPVDRGEIPDHPPAPELS